MITKKKKIWLKWSDRRLGHDQRKNKCENEQYEAFMYFIIICILVLLAKSPSTNTYMAVQIIRIAKDEFNVCLCVSKRNRYNSEIIWCLKIFLPIYTFDATANFFSHWNLFSFTQLQHRFILIMSTYIWVYNNCGTLWNNKKNEKLWTKMKYSMYILNNMTMFPGVN